ncbi:hypothetical protein BgAZ_209430 [Babesia gibsoni]|uniref:Uncharacterized protein n=1 Tax=Babesia gibsoni TaxID=33632 RepID=A0AAD8PEU9_BABGI|nr:hypothetical protein BgAZ_209430 [Babesia gibsoni]
MTVYHRIASSFLRDSIARAALARRACLSGISARAVAPLGCRGFSTLGCSVFDSPKYKKFIEDAKKSYGGNREVDAAMAEMLTSKPLVLFMEGSLDHPKSLCAGNLSKIFSSLQITGIHTVDLLQHPEILGYLCTHLNESVRTVLFKDGQPMLDYDLIMELFKKGTLLQALEVPARKGDPSTHKHFKGFLPIANY